MENEKEGEVKCLTFISYFMTNELANSVISLHNFEMRCKIKVAEIFLEDPNLNSSQFYYVWSAWLQETPNFLWVAK